VFAELLTIDLVLLAEEGNGREGHGRAALQPVR
jgi:hypothetical protein